MKKLDLLAAVLVVVGAANWGLVALAEFDLVAAVFGLDFGETNPATVSTMEWSACPACGWPLARRPLSGPAPDAGRRSRNEPAPTLGWERPSIGRGSGRRNGLTAVALALPSQAPATEVGRAAGERPGSTPSTASPEPRSRSASTMRRRSGGSPTARRSSESRCRPAIIAYGSCRPGGAARRRRYFGAATPSRPARITRSSRASSRPERRGSRRSAIECVRRTRARRLTVRHTAKAPAVNVWAGGSTLIGGRHFTWGGNRIVAVPGGKYRVKVTLPGSARPVIGPRRLSLRAGSAYQVHAVGTAGHYRLVVVRTHVGTH